MNLAVRIYAAAGWLARPGLRLMLRRRLRQGKEVPDRLRERFGIAGRPRPPGRLIWFHAASVGETMSILPVIAALDGRCSVLLTTGTATSAALAAARLPAFALHQFVPLDIEPWVAAFVGHWRPDCAVFVESEIWPVTLSLLDAAGIPRLLINARLSARSAARWARAPRLRRRLLGAFRYIHAQSAQDAENLAALGLTDILQWGNLKFAAPKLPADPAALAALRDILPPPFWLAASTHPGEEAAVIAAHRHLCASQPRLITVIVPRHPGRAAVIAAMATGLSVSRRSAGAAPVPGGIYLADTLDELGLFYRLAPFAFIGNSLCPPGGGHNVIEPARLGVALLCGPHSANFAAPVAMLTEAGGLREVADAAGLAAAAQTWLAQPALAATAGAAGQLVFDGFEELPARIATLILSMSL